MSFGLDGRLQRMAISGCRAVAQFSHGGILLMKAARHWRTGRCRSVTSNCSDDSDSELDLHVTSNRGLHAS